MPIAFFSYFTLFSLAFFCLSGGGVSELYAQSPTPQIATIHQQQYLLHPIDSGETLFQIAQRYEVPLLQLMTRPAHWRQHFYQGYQLPIPLAAKNTQTYHLRTHEVQAGDYLYKLSRTYQTPVPVLRLLNQLATDTLQAEQQLVVQVLTTDSTQVELAPWMLWPAQRHQIALYHEVHAGETLYSLSQHYTTPVDSLKAWNQLTGHQLEVGDSLKVKMVASPEEAVAFKPKSPATEMEVGMARRLAQNTSAKALALHRTVPKGTMLKVAHPGTGRHVWVKVVGAVPDIGLYKGVDMLLSARACQKLDAHDEAFRVTWFLPIAQEVALQDSTLLLSVPDSLEDGGR